MDPKASDLPSENTKAVETQPYTPREIFSKSYLINPKSDFIYHFQNQSENGKYNVISG